MILGSDRALADALGGPDGGWSFWRAALAAVEIAVERSRERDGAFTAYPQGEWGRFLRDLEDALGLAAVGVDLQLLLNGEPDGKGARRRATIEDVLGNRVRAIIKARAALT